MARRKHKTDPGVAVAYLRASKDEQTLSFDAQRALVETWAAANEVIVADFHEDHGFSGGISWDERPALGRALLDFQERRAGIFIVAKRDRLARDVLSAVTVERAIENSGGRLISADGAGNGSTPTDKLTRDLLNSIAEFERALIRQRTKAALDAKRARGERVGSVPYGYRLASDGNHHMITGGERSCAAPCKGCLHIELDPEEQETIQLARELYDGGRSTLRRVARALADRGKFNRKGNLFDLNQLGIFMRSTPTVLSCGRGHVHEDVTRVGAYCCREECAAGRGDQDPTRRIEWRTP